MKGIKRCIKHVVAIGVSVVPCVHSFAGSVDFNTAGGLSNNFTWVTGSQYGESGSVGTGGSGGVSVGSTANIEATYNGGTYTFSQIGSSVTGSIDFKWDSVNGNGGARFIALGFSSTPGGDQLSGCNVGVNCLSGSTDNVKLSAAVQSSLTGSSSATLVNGEWYRLTGIFTKTSAEPRYTATAELYSLGSSGTGTPVSLLTLTQNQISSVIDGFPVYLEVTAYQAYAGGAVALDNFSTTINPPKIISLIAIRSW